MSNNTETTKSQAQVKPFKLPTASFSANDLAEVTQYLNAHVIELLKIPAVNGILAKNRLLKVDRDNIERVATEDPAVIENCIDYNISCLDQDLTLTRPSKLIDPLSQIGWIEHNKTKLDVLTIGPRSETEIFTLIGSGFNASRIRGLDLFSFSPYIDVGDMHEMPYPDNSFDVIILGWVLAYSSDNEKAIKEVLRVAKPGAHIAIGCQVSHLDDEYWRNWSKTFNKPHITSTCTFKTTQDIHDMFGDTIDNVIFKDDCHPHFKGGTYHLKTIFRLK
jgi:hypothetical protein